MIQAVKQGVGRCLRPALAPLRGSARFAVFGLAAIAIAGCGQDWDEWREQNRREGAIRAAQEHVQSEFDTTYQTCINRVTGAFSSASIEVMKECERQGCIAADSLRLRGEPAECTARQTP